MANKQRNEYLNYWKGIACFCVVFLHTRFPIVALDGMLQTLCRFAVPLFFMVSGYFCYSEDREVVEKKLQGKKKRIFWINLSGCVYYFLFQMAIALLGDSHGSLADVIERIKILFNKTTMVEWIVFNQDPFVHIMWFTSALLYCYLIFWVINHFNLYRIFYGLIPVFLVIHLILGNILILFDMEIVKCYYRNFLLFGMPFFMLGNWLHKHHDYILGKFTVRKCQLILCVGLVLGVGEWFLLGRREMYLGSLLAVISIFLLTLYQPEKKKNSFITKIGTEYSLFVYVVHVSVVLVMERFSSKLIVEGSTVYYAYGFIRPFLVFVICVIGAWVFYRLLNILNQQKHSK